MTATELWDIFEEESSLLDQAEHSSKDFEVYGLSEEEAEKLYAMLQNWREQYDNSEPDDCADLIEIINDEEEDEDDNNWTPFNWIEY